MTTSIPSDRLETAPPLRKSRPCRAVDVGLAGILISASLLHFSLFSRMDADVLMVFFRALMISTALSVVPLMLIRFLDRRERENPWLLAAAFLWGGCIATALSLPFNTAFFPVGRSVGCPQSVGGRNTRTECSDAHRRAAISSDHRRTHQGGWCRLDLLAAPRRI